MSIVVRWLVKNYGKGAVRTYWQLFDLLKVDKSSHGGIASQKWLSPPSYNSDGVARFKSIGDIYWSAWKVYEASSFVQVPAKSV